jgi:hypothetical protein
MIMWFSQINDGMRSVIHILYKKPPSTTCSRTTFTFWLVHKVNTQISIMFFLAHDCFFSCSGLTYKNFLIETRAQFLLLCLHWYGTFV